MSGKNGVQPSALSGDDLPLHGESDEFGICLEAEFPHRTIFVKGYGPRRNGQGFGDFSHGFPLCQESDDFSLTGSESLALPIANKRLHLGDYRGRADSKPLSDVTGGVHSLSGSLPLDARPTESRQPRCCTGIQVSAILCVRCSVPFRSRVQGPRLP